MTMRKTGDMYNTNCQVVDSETVIVQGMKFVKRITCKYIWDEKQKAWVCSNCGGIEPCSNDVNFCCDCGAEVIG